MVANATKKKNRGNQGSLNKELFYIKRREFIQNILVPEAPFDAVKIPINPGTDSFPWAKQVAPSFAKYQLKKLAFSFETAVSTFSPGMVMIAPQFNIAKAMPKNKTQVLELMYAERAPIWENFTLNIPRSEVDTFKEYFVRTDEVVNEPKLYDPLYIIVATDSVDLDRPYIGELWIDYELELREPVFLEPSEVDVGNYLSFQTGLIANPTPFLTKGPNVGNLQLQFLPDNKTVVFMEDFTGMILCIIGQANIGLADLCYEMPLSYTLVSESGTVQGPAAVGGNGYDGDTQGFTMWLLGVKDVIAGERLTFNNAGFYAVEGDDASTSQWYFMKGMDWFVPPVSVSTKSLLRQAPLVKDEFFKKKNSDKSVPVDKQRGEVVKPKRREIFTRSPTINRLNILDDR